MFKSFFLAKLIQKIHLSSFKMTEIDCSSKVSFGCDLTIVKIGRYSYVGDHTHITDCEIGSFCSIGSNCDIGGGIHPMQFVSTSPVFLHGKNILHKNFSDIPYKPSKHVIIGNDVWIGDGVYIKSGLTVGSGAIIGAHAVVTHDVSPYSIVAGVPAREIRKRFTEIVINKMLKIKWWDWSDQKITTMSKMFDSPLNLISAVEKESRK